MEIKGNYLHLRLKRTKRSIPYVENISPDLYPEQNLTYLNCRKTIRIKDDYRIIPEDAPWYYKYSDPQVINVPCTVIRYDNVEPYVAVYVDEKYGYVVVGSSKEPESEEPEVYPLIYPIQNDKDFDDAIGLYGYLQTGYINNDNMLLTFEKPAIVISSDFSEPGLDVIIYQYSETEYKVFLSSEVWLDIQGSIITDPVMTSKVKTIEVRKHALEGKTPYGLNQN